MRKKISNEQLIIVKKQLPKLTEVIAPALSFQKLLEMGQFGLKIKEAGENLQNTIQLQLPEELKTLINDRNDLISACKSDVERMQKLNAWTKEARFQNLYEDYTEKIKEVNSQKNPETFNFKLTDKDIEMKKLGKDANTKIAPYIECLSILLMND